MDYINKEGFSHFWAGLKNILRTKANVESPVLTGTPTAPTALDGTSTEQIATTAFVQRAVSSGGGGGDDSGPTALTLLLPADGWTGDTPPYTQTIAVAGATADVCGLVSNADLTTPLEYKTFLLAQMRKTAQADNSMTFEAMGLKPHIDLPLKVLLYGLGQAVEGTLLADGWTGDYPPYEQVLVVAGMTEDSSGLVGISDNATQEQFAAASSAVLQKYSQATDSLTMRANSAAKPSVDIPITIIIT